MLQHEAFWSSARDSVDLIVARAATSYIRLRRVDGGSIRRGFDELQLLRTRQDPRYTNPGVVAAYAFSYLPKRALSVLGALRHAPLKEAPRRVLDVGSGSGAASIALSLWAPDEEIEVIGVDPSEEMHYFARIVCDELVVNKRLFVGSWEDIGRGEIEVDPEIDLVVMSAFVQYGQDTWSRAWDRSTEVVTDVTSNTASLIAIEPDAKAATLASLARAFEKTRRWQFTENVCCHSVSGEMREVMVLKGCTAVQNASCPDWNYPVTSWNENRRDFLRIGRFVSG